MAILEVINIAKSFGGIEALKGVSLAVAKGEIFGLIGPNGAGKSTLVDLISGFSQYSTGDIRFFGRSIRGLKPHQIGKLGIGRTFQNIKSSTNMTVLEIVMSGTLFGKSGRLKSMRSIRNRAKDNLDFLGLSAKADIPAVNLTLPDRKRLEMARALAIEPSLLILDEVTDGLNNVEIEDWMRIVRNIRDAGVTVMVIEHIFRAISGLCDRVAVLNQGQKVMIGPPDKVLSNQQILEFYLGKRQ